jgi:integrase
MLYSELLKHCPDWLRRAVAFSWETSLSRSDLFNLTWNEIDLAESIIELKYGRAKTGKPQVIPIEFLRRFPFFLLIHYSL